MKHSIYKMKQILWGIGIETGFITGIVLLFAMFIHWGLR